MGEKITADKHARWRGPVGAALAGTVMAALLTGCGTQDPPSVAGDTRAGAGSPSAAEQAPPGAADPMRSDVARSPVPTPTAAKVRPVDDDGAGAEQVVTEAAQPERAVAEAARTRATAFLRAFARTDLAQDEWWAGVRGYFTPAAAEIYSRTDVANVPVRAVREGSAELDTKRSTKYRAEVAVGSNIGTYTIVLIYAGGQWLVERAIPPAGAG